MNGYHCSLNAAITELGDCVIWIFNQRNTHPPCPLPLQSSETPPAMGCHTEVPGQRIIPTCDLLWRTIFDSICVASFPRGAHSWAIGEPSEKSNSGPCDTWPSQTELRYALEDARSDLKLLSRGPLGSFFNILFTRALCADVTERSY